MMKVNYWFKQTFLLPMLIGSLVLSVGCDRGDNYKRENGTSETDIRADQSSGNDQESQYDENEAEYPEEKVLDDTNLDSDQPLETGAAISLIEKRKLLASLMRQKTEIMYRIEELSSQSRNQDTASVISGDIDKLRTYLDQLDDEITKVRVANPNDMQQVEESAQAAIKASGALMQSAVMRIDRGY